MKQKLIILKGLPASGKTTFAKKYVLDNPLTIRVNRDDIRSMLTPNFKHGSSMEGLVTLTEDLLIKEGLSNGYSVIVDATNLRGHERFIELMPRESNIELSVEHFVIDLEEAIKRDNNRENKCGKEVIERMYYKYVDKVI